jgi:drug/metabolite transporter (DMT)-like permease
MNLFKNGVAVVCLILSLLILRPPLPAGSYGPILWLALSGIIGIALGDTAFFAALKHLGTQVTSAIQCLAPPVAALVAAWAWGETLSIAEMSGMTLTVSAVFGIIYFGKKDGAALAHLSRRDLGVGIVLAVLSALCQAMGIVISRYSLQDVHVIPGTLLRLLPAVLVLTVTGILSPRGLAMGLIFRKGILPYRLALAAFAGAFVGLILMSVGTKYAKAGVVAALSSTYPIWIIPFARIYLHEKGNWQSALCAVIAVLGIVFMLI